MILKNVAYHAVLQRYRAVGWSLGHLPSLGPSNEFGWNPHLKGAAHKNVAPLWDWSFDRRRSRGFLRGEIVPKSARRLYRFGCACEGDVVGYATKVSARSRRRRHLTRFDSP